MKGQKDKGQLTANHAKHAKNGKGSQFKIQNSRFKIQYLSSPPLSSPLLSSLLRVPPLCFLSVLLLCISSLCFFSSSLFAEEKSAASEFAEGESVVENFRIPLEKYANGKVKVLLVAKRAHIPVGGAVRATGVTVELYDAEGAFEGLLKAEGLTVNPETREAHDARPVSLEYRGVTISGDGYTWDNEKQTIRVESNVVMRITLGEASLIRE